MWSLMEIYSIEADRQPSGKHCLSVDADFWGKAGFLAAGNFEQFAYTVTWCP
jgi:hypothetical protein